MTTHDVIQFVSPEGPAARNQSVLELQRHIRQLRQFSDYEGQP